MALKKHHEVNFHGKNVLFENCYFKVCQVAGTKQGVVASVDGLHSDSVVSHKEYVFTPSMDGKNFIAQAYEHLKTLPEFSGATDC
jgi:hypothetical protein